MAQRLTLEIVTPEKVMLKTTADYVTLPGMIGELGILAGHIPLLTSLQSGVLRYRSSGTESRFAIHHGYAEVLDDKITVLATKAEAGEDIDAEAAKEARRKAEQELADAIKGSADAEEIERVLTSITTENTRLETVE